MAHRFTSQQRSHSVAFGEKRHLASCAYSTGFMNTHLISSTEAWRAATKA